MEEAGKTNWSSGTAVYVRAVSCRSFFPFFSFIILFFFFQRFVFSEFISFFSVKDWNSIRPSIEIQYSMTNGSPHFTDAHCKLCAVHICCYLFVFFCSTRKMRTFAPVFCVSLVEMEFVFIMKRSIFQLTLLAYTKYYVCTHKMSQKPSEKFMIQRNNFSSSFISNSDRISIWFWEYMRVKTKSSLLRVCLTQMWSIGDWKLEINDDKMLINKDHHRNIRGKVSEMP